MMLYDPKWEQKTQVNPITVENFVAWLEQKPANEVYYTAIPVICALGQWLRSMGMHPHDAGNTSLMLGEIEPWEYIAIGPDGYTTDTFGAALERARKYASTEST